VSVYVSVSVCLRKNYKAKLLQVARCPRRARLVLASVTVSGFNPRCGTSISVCN